MHLLHRTKDYMYIYVENVYIYSIYFKDPNYTYKPWYVSHIPVFCQSY